jgi:hypothetical protein
MNPGYASKTALVAVFCCRKPAPKPAETEEVVGLTILNLASRFGTLETPQTLPVEIEVYKSEM